MESLARVYNHDLILFWDAFKLGPHYITVRDRFCNGLHSILALMNADQKEKFDVPAWYIDKLLPHFPPAPTTSDLVKSVFGESDFSDTASTIGDEQGFQTGIRSGKKA